MQDFRLAIRTIRGTPVIAAAAILSLALGIGASTAMFALVNSLALRVLPVADPERLVTLSTGPAATQAVFTYATFEEIRRQQRFGGVSTYAASLLTIENEPRNVLSQWVSGEFFSTLGVRPFKGRTLTTADDVAGGGPDGPAGMISYRLWQGRFGGAEDIIGRSVRVERVPVTIVGITPPEFLGVEVGQAFDLFLPVSINALIRPSIPYDVHTPWLRMLLRLRPGDTREAAMAALRAAQPGIKAASLPPGTSNAEFLKDPFVLDPALHGTSSLRQRYQRPLVTLLALSGLVLLVACVNLANLFLAKGAARRHELSMRLALGASRGQLIRLLLVETVTLASIGAVLGLLAARWASQALVAQLSTSDPPITLDLSLDARVLAFTVAMAFVTAMFFGLVPALRATDTTAMEALKQAGRGTAGAASPRVFNLLLVGQVAVSLLLVIAAGLLVRTAQQLSRAPLGFDDEQLLTVTITAPTVPAAERNVFYHHLVETVAAMPGVASAGGSLDAPLTRFSAGIPASVSGAVPLAAAQTISQLIPITPGWLPAYGTPLRAGRDIDGRDVTGAEPVMLVNDAFARRFFPGARLAGRTVTVTLDVPPTGKVSLGPKTIVGIVGDAVYSSVREPVPPTIYVPLAQREGPLFFSVFFMAVRSVSASPAQLARSVTTTLQGVNPDLRVTPRLATEQVNALLAQDRLVARLAVFGGIQALLLATLGLYGVTAYAVWRRRTEMGIRIALGGTPATVIRLMLSRVIGLVLAGVLLGSAAALWAASYMSPLLYGVRPHDPPTFFGAAALLTLAGLIASGLPAIAASRVDPAKTLRL
jgi:putative ABC transport system permease protein